ncbi:lamin tail domain-containing protein, partial [Candidatus Berkelbacteria bacterium]|nr:lamin tail domain-containing protein [Candidatus Berkelbacteria bacterium]
MKKLLFWFILIFLVIENFGLGLFYLPLKAKAAAPASHVVISEIQIGGSTATDEFVELYNPTSATIDLSNWRLSGKSSSGTLGNLLTSFPKDANILAFSFLLIAHPNYTGSVKEDLSYSTNNSLAINNTIILYSDAGLTTVDKVGWGTAKDFEGNAFALNPANVQGLERKPGNLYPEQGNGLDTNNNDQDFDLRTISQPQNSASAPEDPNAPQAPTNLTVVDVANDDGGALQIAWDFSTSNFVTG